MTTDPTVPPELVTKPGGMTQAQCAHLFRSIEHAVTYDRLVSPTAVDMQPKYGSAILRFADDDVETVREWAARTGATVGHSAKVHQGPPSWRGFDTRLGGARGQLAGWAVDLWCVVFEPEPVEVDEPPAVAEPEPAQEWLFTFGSGQQHDGRFVRIQGTYDSARQRMLAVFGNRWCAQYDWQRFDEEGLPARVTELPESEWPPVVDDDEPAEVPTQQSGR